MSIEVTEQSILSLAEYARIPIAFQVNRILDVACPPHEGGAFVLTERDAHPAVVKDYDAGQNGPLTWTRRFDLSNWAMFSARFDGRRAGGAVVVYRSPDIEMLEDRDDLALLWDIRVAPEMRGKGIGSALLEKAETWIARKGAVSLKVETQNINVPACRFYERHGFGLRAANAGAYPDFPDEIQLLWYKELPST